METPDKIYVNFPFGEKYPWRGPMVTKQGLNQNDTTFIRKDALMKIIETARESAIVQRNYNNCPVEQEARVDAYDYIKHKIESL